MYQQQKRYNTAMDRFTDFKLGTASKLKRERACVALAVQVAMHSQLPRFCSYYYLPWYFIPIFF